MEKKFGPTVVLVIMICVILLYAGGMVFAFTKEGLAFIWKALFTIVPLIIIIALISVYIERIREIDEDENENLDKY